MILKYPGGKSRIGLRELLSLFPQHYSEFRSPFAGNEPLLWHVRSDIPRWVNDIDKDLIAYWKALRDDKNFSRKFFALLDSIESADELVEAFEQAKHKIVFDRDPVSYLFVRRLAHRQIVSRARPNLASFCYQYIKDGLKPVTRQKFNNAQEICSGIKITCGNYLKVFRPPAKRGTCLLMVDPPYHLTESISGIYENELTADEHETLRDELASLNPKTHKFLLTLGHTELTDQLYIGDDRFNVHYRRVRYGGKNPNQVWCTLSPHRQRKRELIVLNYAP